MKGYYSNSCSEACTWNHKLTYPCDYGCNPNGECRSSYGCKENDEICVLGTRFICDAASVWMRRNNDCVDPDENPVSDNSNPDENQCNEGETRCKDNQIYIECKNGQWSQEKTCEHGCDMNTNSCKTQTENQCNDGETMCKNNVFYWCNSDKKYEIVENCTEEEYCDDKLGCKYTDNCTPGERKCFYAPSQYFDYKYVYKECNSNRFWKILDFCSDACDDETGCPDSTPGDFNSKCSEETLISCDECTPVCENGTDYYYCNKKIGIMVHEKCSSCSVDSNGIGSKNNCTQKGLTCNDSNSKYVCYNNNVYYCKEGQVDIRNCPNCTNGVHNKSDVLNCINN